MVATYLTSQRKTHSLFPMLIIREEQGKDSVNVFSEKHRYFEFSFTIYASCDL